MKKMLMIAAAAMLAGCVSQGVRQDGSYYSRIEWASHTVDTPLYWVYNLLDDDIKRDGGSWGANSKRKPANVILSFFGDEMPVGTIRFYHNVGASGSMIEELAKDVNIYVSSDDEISRLGGNDADLKMIKWKKIATKKLEKKEYWADISLEEAVMAKYVRIELVNNFFDDKLINSLDKSKKGKENWTETNEIKIFP